MDTTTTRSILLSTALLMALSAVLTSAVGCGGSQNKEAANLQTSVRLYHHAIRMGRYHEASKYLKPEDRNAYIGRYEELGEDFEIVEVEAKVINMVDEGEKARSETEVRWYRLPDMTVNRDKITETWEQVDGAWMIIDRDVKPVKKKKRLLSAKKNDKKDKVSATLP